MIHGDTETMRCFLGLPVPPPIRDALGTVCQQWKQAGLAGAWVEPKNYHITLRFLGNTTACQLEQLDAILPGAFRRCVPLELRVRGAGVFPDLRHPRVLWAGLEVLSGSFEPVLDAAAQGADAIGLPSREKESHPHITLLRFWRPPPAGRLQGCLGLGESLAAGDFRAGPVALWRSQLLPGGAEYQQLREYPFA